MSREHDGHGRAGGPLELLALGQPALRGVEQQFAQRGFEHRQDGLGLGIAEARVELDDLDAALGHGETAVEHPHEGGAAASQFVDHGAGHAAHDLVREPLGQPLERRVGAHATRVGALVTVANALEVLGRLQWDHVLAVAEHEQGHFRAVQELLDDHGTARVQAFARVGLGTVPVRRDHHALARGQPVVLNHVGRTETLEGRPHVREIRRGHRSRGGDTCRRHDLLGERLGALDPRGLCGRTEHGDARTGEGVCDTGDERCLRSHDHEVRVQLPSQRDHGLRVLRVEGMYRDVLGDPLVTGCAVHLADVRVP